MKKVARRLPVQNLQFVGMKIHDGIRAIVCPLAAVGKVFAVGTIGTHGGDGSRLDERLGKHVLIADDNGPLREALQLDIVVIAGLRVEVKQLRLGSLLVELGATADGLATAVRRLVALGRGGRGSSRAGIVGLLGLLCRLGSRSLGGAGIGHFDVGFFCLVLFGLVGGLVVGLIGRLVLGV